jgi:two-component system sensor histidine kinase UhpB
VTTGGEVGELQASIGEMSVALDQSTQDLENKVAERTRDLLASRNEALRADADKRKLIQKVNSIIEDERKSIAVEIHDELNASLIAVRLEAQTIRHAGLQGAPGPESRDPRQGAGDHQAGARPVRQRPPPGAPPASRSAGHARPARRGRGDAAPLRLQFRLPLRLPFRGRFLAARQRAGDFRLPHRAGSAVEHHEARRRDAPPRSRLVLDEAKTLHIEVERRRRRLRPGPASEGIGIIGMRERVYALAARSRCAPAGERGTRWPSRCHSPAHTAVS